MQRQFGFFKKNLFRLKCIFGGAGSSLLHGLFSSCSRPGLLSSGGAQVSHRGGFS